MVHPVQLENEATNLFVDIDPSPDPGNDGVSSTDETSDNSARRVRGYSRSIELDKYVNLHERILIQISDELEKSVCDFATKFSDVIDTIVRESFPVHLSKWKDVPAELKDYVKNKLLNHFELDLSEYVVHEFIDHEMQTTFKEYRADLVKHYRKYSPEEGRAHPHPRVVDIADWHLLCDRWETPKWKSQMIKLQEAPTSKESQPLTQDEILETISSCRSSHVKDMSWGPKLKQRKCSSSTSSRETRREHKLHMELAQLRSENAHQVEELNQIKEELNHVKAEIEFTKEELERVKTNETRTRNRLEKVETRFIATNAKLASLQAMLTQIMHSQGGLCK